MYNIIFLFLAAPVLAIYEFDENDVKLLLYTRENPSTPLIITDENQNVIDKSLEAKIIIFGWTQDPAAPWIPDMTATYLRKDSYNVFVLDWSVCSQTEYVFCATYCVPNVGTYFAQLLLKLITGGYDENKLHAIGHSLGAQIAGVAGNELQTISGGQKIARISALDAAKPLFEVPLVSAEKRITADDATFVDAVHTDTKELGYGGSFAHFDCYPNGGAYQPPCPINVPPPNSTLESIALSTAFCNHGQSIAYWNESITTDGFVARKCSSYVQYLTAPSLCSDSAIMGENASPSTRGVYYLTTNLFPPYAKN